jgi:hypothetical protein
MGYAPMRSMNAELDTGLADGRYKQVIKDRGGFPEGATEGARRDLHDMWYGIHETPRKQLATLDGPRRTQGYTATPEADPWG